MALNKEEQQALRQYQDKNQRLFQVMGALKLMKIKVRNFLEESERISDASQEIEPKLKTMFLTLRKEINYFQKEQEMLMLIDVQSASLDSFVANAHRLFEFEEQNGYQLRDMNMITTYMRDQADFILEELAFIKKEIDAQIRAIQARGDKYVHNLKSGGIK